VDTGGEFRAAAPLEGWGKVFPMREPQIIGESGDWSNREVRPGARLGVHGLDADEI
jgi:hypothetical protein